MGETSPLIFLSYQSHNQCTEITGRTLLYRSSHPKGKNRARTETGSSSLKVCIDFDPYEWFFLSLDDPAHLTLAPEPSSPKIEPLKVFTSMSKAPVHVHPYVQVLRFMFLL